MKQCSKLILWHTTQKKYLLNAAVLFRAYKGKCICLDKEKKVLEIFFIYLFFFIDIRKPA